MAKLEPVIFKGFLTTNNVQHKARLRGPTIGNPVDFAECQAIVNADITDTLSAKRRAGITKVYTGTPHSLWSNGTECYFVEGSYLKRLLPTFTTAVTIRTLSSPSLPMSYAQVNYLTVCSNGVDLFLIENGIAYDFEYSSQRFKEAVEAGHIVTLFNRRLFVAIDNVLYYTDADDIQRLDERDDPFAFRERIRGVYPLQNGMYVMADKVYWMAGKGPDDFTLTEAYDGKMIEGCGTVYDGALSGSPGKRVRFVTSDGICDGDDGGTVQNTTLNTLSFTAQRKGAAIIRKLSGYNQFIAWV